MTRKIYAATDATYIDKIRELRNILYSYKHLVGQRPLGDPYDRVLYQNLVAATDALAKIVKDHTKYRKPVPTSRRGNGGIRGSATRIKKKLEMEH